MSRSARRAERQQESDPGEPTEPHERPSPRAAHLTGPAPPRGRKIPDGPVPAGQRPRGLFHGVSHDRVRGGGPYRRRGRLAGPGRRVESGRRRGPRPPREGPRDEGAPRPRPRRPRRHFRPRPPRRALRHGPAGEGDDLREAARHLRAALHLEPLRERVPLLRLPRPEQGARAPRADPGGDRPRGALARGAGAQADPPRRRRGVPEGRLRLRPEVDRDDLRHVERAGRDPPRQRQRRAAHRGGVPSA